MSSTSSQVFYYNQLVTPDDMNNFFNTIGNDLNTFFPTQPAICSGLTYTQNGTTNTINFNGGYVRFTDQTNVLSQTIAQTTIAPIDAVSTTITCPQSATQYFIVAKLDITQISASSLAFSSHILTTAMTLAEIASQINPLAYAPLFTITNNSGVYTIGTNSDCAYNYGRIIASTNYATTLIAGIIQLATNAEALAGTNNNKSIVPSSLQAKINALLSTTNIWTDTNQFNNGALVPTRPANDNSGFVANTAFVLNALSNAYAAGAYVRFSLPNGFTFQAYETTQIPSGGSITVPLPVAYTQNYQVLVTAQNASSAVGSVSFGWAQISLTSFKIVNNGIAELRVTWFAIGI